MNFSKSELRTIKRGINMEDAKRANVDLCISGGFFLLFGVALCVIEQMYAFALSVLALGMILLPIGLFRLRFPNLYKEHCSGTTTCLALAFSASFSVAIAWILSLVVYDVFDPDAKFSRLEVLFFRWGWISLLIPAASLALYVWKRRKHPSRKGAWMDAGLCVLFLLPFFAYFCLLFSFAERWI